MALTVSTTSPQSRVPGDRRRAVASVTFDNSYATGGLAFTPAAVGLNVIEDTVITVTAPVSAAAVVTYDATNQKLKALVQAGTEVAAATNLSALTVQVVCSGW